ncbi:MAG: hypothetical protein IJ087_03560 [Eggerthellaceae bacterium]|nr:hypothetical protein [Eggerthellaceae bacterium]
MAVGTVSTRILTDIANAIRFQRGDGTLFKPREMAAAVAALDGSYAGDYQAQPYMALESGVLPESVFEDIADAIRGQNGSSDTYLPGEMAAAILALSWDVGLKPRAVLTSLGTLEFNYVDGRHCYSGGVPVDAWEIDPAGYSSASARPYDEVKLQVRKVVIHSSWTQVGMIKADYLFNAFQNMTEVSGFENMSGITSAAQMFTSCPALETIYATSFSNAGLSGSLMFNGCNRLVGGTDGFVPSTTSGASVCKLGAGGVLTDPNNDSRHWFWAHYYADGEGVLTASSTPESGRELVASGRICAEAKYVGLGFTPWDGVTGPTHRQHLTSATFAADMAGFSYLNFQYIFYSCTSLASISGLDNLSGVRSMRFMFASTAVQVLDFRGFDPSALTDLYYTFSSCSSLTTMYANASWALPTSGISGSQCFYSCSTNLVGGNGTVWASSKTAYTYFRIDTASTPGFLTAA